MDSEEQTVPEKNKDKIEDATTSRKIELMQEGMLHTNTRVRIMVILFLMLVYILLFTFLFTTYGKAMGMSAVIPVIVVGWLYGFVPGVCTAVLSFPVNIFMYELFGLSWLERFITSANFAGTAILIIVSALVGRIRDLGFQLKRELSERDLAEEELRKTKDYLNNIIESSLDGIVVSDNRGYITRVNESFLKLIDFEEEEIIGKHMAELLITEEGTYESTTGELVEIGEEFFNDAKEIAEKLFEEGKTSNWESYYLRKDRKIVPVEVEIAYLYDKGKDIIGSVGINKDITKRKRSERVLKKAYDELEKRIEERTDNLKAVNEKLKQEIIERKRTEEELRETKDHLSDIIESSLDGIVISDGTGYITRANKRFMELIDFEEEEIIGKHMAELSVTEKGTYESTTGELVKIGEEFFDDVNVMVEKLIKEGRILNWSSYCLRKDRKIVPVEMNIVNLYNEEGNAFVSFGITRDITERRKIEKEIRDNRDFLENIFKTSADGIVITDPKGSIIMANEAIIKMLGYSQDELIGKHVVELFQGEKYEKRNKKLITKLYKDGFVIGFEHTWARKDGRLVDIEFNAAMLFDKEGNITGTVTNIRDITERKKAEKEIGNARDFLENIFRTSADGIIITDHEGSIIMVNEAVEKMLGYSHDELIGKHIVELVARGGQYGERGYETFAKLLRDCVSKFEHPFVRKDGSLVDIAANAAMLYDKEGNITGTVTNIRDITEHKRAEKEREWLLGELKDKNKELEQVFYIASHDLRSPLVNVQGFSKELEQAFKQVHSVMHSKGVPSTIEEKLAPTLEEDIPEALQYILTSVSKMDSLLSGLLRLSRLGRAALNIKQLDINKLILDIVRSFDFQIKCSGVKLQIDELPPCIGDETQINQVFSNLLDNALKYLAPNRAGIIRISGREENGQALYYIEDNGIGIAEEHQDKIYEIFRRLNPEACPGEGLGLTIARRILDRHAGRIWVESEHYKGSKFFVSLPTN